MRYLSALLMVVVLAGCPADPKDTRECVVNADCPDGEECVAQICFPVECDAAETVCGRECVDTQTEMEHCGGCDGCEALEGAAALQCVTGICVYGCLGGAVDANGDLDEPGSDGCECVPSGPEICDGIDNDCNGAIDGDDFGLAACPNEDGAEGVCEDGGCIYTCKEGAEDVNGDLGTGGNGCECLRGEAEICDGFDNDCDGDIDSDDEDLVEPVCGLSVGVCAGLGTECVDGAPLECSEALYVAYAEAEGLRFQAGVETFCDVKDNNCDGATDELCCGAQEGLVVLGEDMGTLTASASNGETAAALFVGDSGVELFLVGAQMPEPRRIAVEPDAPDALKATVFWSEPHRAFFVIHTFFVGEVLFGVRVVQITPDGTIGSTFQLAQEGATQLFGVALDEEHIVVGSDRQNSTTLVLVSTTNQTAQGSAFTALSRTDRTILTSRITVVNGSIFVLGDAFSTHPLFPINSTTLWRVERDGVDLDGEDLMFFPRETDPDTTTPSSGAFIEADGDRYRLFWVSKGEAQRPGVVSQELSSALELIGDPLQLTTEPQGSFHLAGVRLVAGNKAVISGWQTPDNNPLGLGRVWLADVQMGGSVEITVTDERTIRRVAQAAHPHGHWIFWSEVTGELTRRWLGTIINIEGDLLCPWPE